MKSYKPSVERVMVAVGRGDAQKVDDLRFIGFLLRFLLLELDASAGCFGRR